MEKPLTVIAAAVFEKYPCVVSASYFKEKRRWLVSEKSWVSPFTLAKEEYGLATSFRQR